MIFTLFFKFLYSQNKCCCFLQKAIDSINARRDVQNFKTFVARSKLIEHIKSKNDFFHSISCPWRVVDNARDFPQLT
ncbi:hypothetical protein FR483_n009R [Paramecium bursaria Chlorella virus FR483]|uniref:Uncharacterized protein n009R n=1 Tax=Paramecium bursaria Chlorella virus FR483 TaxID=399781 RepID=A7J663_PBCVF|nr:hypothetical protein FR483_n009R [Paramecium bursaria Chlorella virus FR483]ABT15294.1 hypothetical protein FR483_n009R [Paramecium bursaria Chlorella virus FR483]